MQRWVWFLALGLFAAGLGAESAFAAGTTTTTTIATTTAVTSTGATTTAATSTAAATTTNTPTPSYVRLTSRYLPAGCVGAGAVAIAVPGRRVLVLGTPGSSRGPSVYPFRAPIVRFLSATATGSACSAAHLALGSVSLLGGVISASGVAATHGRGTVSGLEIDGSPVTLRTGRPVQIGNWGVLTLEKTVGRLTAPLVLQLLVAHHSLPAGTTIALAFGASPRAADKSNSNQTDTAGPQERAKEASKTQKGRRQPAKPPPDFPATSSPLGKGGGLTNAAQDNPVVSIAMRYLGIPYQWGGARPSTGFDCSGLVKYVFGQLGVPLVHYAAAQWHSPGGVWIPPDRLQAGDLVFFTGSDGTRKAPGHVGIYVDDGYFIDAPHTGAFVRVDSLSEPKFADEYVGARQVVSQRLAARHPSGVTKPGVPPTDYHLGFPSALTIRPLGESPAVAATVAGRPGARGYLAWGSVALGALFLLLCAALFIRRGRGPDAARTDPGPPCRNG